MFVHPFCLALFLHVSMSVLASRYCSSLDPCWPPSHVWSAFNTSVKGQLVALRPPAAPCHLEDPLFNTETCARINSSWTDMLFRADDPAASYDTYWENGNASCYIDFQLDQKCEQGLVSPIALIARSVSDVQAGVNFARNNRLKLRIRSSGHDLVGRSSGEGSFLIWTHELKNLSIVPSFRPSGAPSSLPGVQALSSGPGNGWSDLYKLANDSGFVVVGGTGQSVSPGGGYVMGGGHSILGRSFGLAVDNVLQFTLVNASGNIIVANEYQNTDLFWALRGGGGGTFGIVTDVVYKTHPPFTRILGVTLSVTAQNTTALSVALEALLNLQPTLDDDGWWLTTSVQFGTAFVMQAALLSIPAQSSNVTELAYQTFAPVLSASHTAGLSSSFDTEIFPNFLALHDTFFTIASQPAGSPAVLGSRLIPRHVFENSTANHLMAVIATQPSVVVFNLLAGGAVAQVPPHSTSVNPGWRKALHLVIFSEFWASSTPLSERDEIRLRVTDETSLLDPFSEGLGAYLNEADANDPQWPHSFWGDNYPRLLDIKQSVDPTGVFECNKCVGSEVFGT